MANLERGGTEDGKDKPVVSKYPTENKEYERTGGQGSSKAERRNEPALGTKATAKPARPSPQA